MKFAIRDDDTAFFTKPSELEKAYDFVEKGCISLSIVPFSVPQHKSDIFPYGQKYEYKEYKFSDNKELIRYLKRGISCKRYDILLHGYSHEYKKINNKWKTEMLWKSKKQLAEEIKEGLNELENSLGKKIKIFVAPNNCINRKGIQVLEENNLNYSGILYFFDRDITFKYFKNFFKRWITRIFLGVPYPNFLEFPNHRELIAYSLDDFERLKKEYNICKKKKLPFVIYSHYWYLNKNKDHKELLKKIYNYIINDGGELVSLSEIFDGDYAYD